MASEDIELTSTSLHDRKDAAEQKVTEEKTMKVTQVERHGRKRLTALAAVVAAAGLLTTAGVAAAAPARAGTASARTASAGTASAGTASARTASARTASAGTARAGTTQGRRLKPSIVLVHGAFADASSWDSVIGDLQRDGYTVYAPPVPLRGIADDSAYLADFLHSISGPIVLVGHSYGGAVITNAATADRQVKALVYVDAFLPAQGETLGQLISAEPGT